MEIVQLSAIVMRKSSAVIVMTTYWKKPRASISKWCFLKTMGLCRYLIMEQQALIYLGIYFTFHPS
jgi:hypothetical protein